MIYEEHNIALLTVGNAALKNPAWTDYANYCLDREKGLRKEAFHHLDQFLKATGSWSLDQKIDFIKFLFPFFETVQDADYGPFPQPLNDKLARPVLLEWCGRESNDHTPFRWYGKYYRSEEHIYRAIELDPADDLSRQVLLSWWTDSLYYSVHHLPEGYIGSPDEDLELENKINEQIERLTDPELKDHWAKEAGYYLELVHNYLEWKASCHADFEKWGQENKRITGLGQATYYYEK